MKSDPSRETLPLHRRAWAYVRDAPLTFVYIAIIAFTTLLLRSVSPRIARAMLRRRSTNLMEIKLHPVRALIASAFWISGPQNVKEFFFWAVLYALIAARVEHWLGHLKTVTVFFASHVGATLFVLAGAAFALSHGYAPSKIAHVIDVGVSYGFAGLAGVYTYRVRKTIRPWYLSTLLLACLIGLMFLGGYGEFGHFVALGLGLAAYPLARSAKHGRALPHPRT